MVNETKGCGRALMFGGMRCGQRPRAWIHGSTPVLCDLCRGLLRPSGHSTSTSPAAPSAPAAGLSAAAAPPIAESVQSRPIETVALCSASRCVRTARMLLHWSGQRTRLCPECTDQALIIASALGFRRDVAVELLRGVGYDVQ